MAKKAKKKKRAILLPAEASTPGVASLRLWEDVKDGVLDPSTLTIEQRRAVVLAALSGEDTPAQIAAILGVNYAVIRRDIRQVKRMIGEDTLEASFSEILGDLVHSAEVCYAKAMQAGQVALAWKVKSEATRLLMKMGIAKPSSSTEDTVKKDEAQESYARARVLLADIMVPALTGEVVRGEQSGKHTEIIAAREETPKKLPLDMEERA